MAELHEQSTKRIEHGHGHTHARGMKEKEPSSKRSMASSPLLTSLEKLRDKEIGSSQSARQKAFMSNFFAPAESRTCRSVDIDDGDGGGHLACRP